MRAHPKAGLDFVAQPGKQRMQAPDRRFVFPPDSCQQLLAGAPGASALHKRFQENILLLGELGAADALHLDDPAGLVMQGERPEAPALPLPLSWKTFGRGQRAETRGLGSGLGQCRPTYASRNRTVGRCQGAATACLRGEWVRRLRLPGKGCRRLGPHRSAIRRSSHSCGPGGTG